jgi:hypothetical protein
MRSQPEPPSLPPFPDCAAGWEFLRYVLRAIASVFGDPIALARRGLIAFTLRAEIAQWLAPAEKLARLLLLAAAATAAPPASRARSRGRGWPPCAREDFSGDASEDWRVSFRLLGGVSKRGTQRREKRPFVPAFSTLPLAARFEALIRVVEAPERYAARMARRLMARRDRGRLVGSLLVPPRTRGAPLMQGPAGALKLAEPARRRFVSDTS